MRLIGAGHGPRPASTGANECQAGMHGLGVAMTLSLVQQGSRGLTKADLLRILALGPRTSRRGAP